jgi:hypothetical protein
MNESRDSRPLINQLTALRNALTPPPPEPAPRAATPSGQDCCDRCGSVRLIRVKACWRCESCGYKSDCNGW